jgi:hypothetical protein
MKRRAILLLLSTLLIGAGSQEGVRNHTLTDRSYGPINFGEKLADVEIRIGERPRAETGDSDCDYVTFSKFPGVRFMIERGVVTRADVAGAEIPNSLGIEIGTTLVEVKRRYPKVVVQAHHYDPAGHYLIFRSEGGRYAIVFEEGDGKVTDVRGGLEPSVEYVEGCQ